MGVTEANSVTLIVFKSSHSPLIKLHLPIRLNFRNFKRLIPYTDITIKSKYEYKESFQLCGNLHIRTYGQRTIDWMHAKIRKTDFGS